MRLSNRVLLTLGVVWVAFLGLSYIGAHMYLTKSYLDLEGVQINKNVVRVRQAIDQVSYALGTFTTDWAHWNDAYEYAEGKNPQFVVNNFAIDGFVNSNINLMLYFNKQGGLLIGMAADLTKKRFVAYPAGLDKYIYTTSFLVRRDDLNNDIRGLILLPSGIMLVAASGLSYGDKSKPINGSLVAGRNFSDALLKKISDATELDLKIYLPSMIENNQTLLSAYIKAIDQGDNPYTVFVNPQTAQAYMVLRDINNAPIGMIQVTIPRVIYFSGSRAIQYYLGAFLISGFLLAALIGYLLRMLVLSRLELLNKQIKVVIEKSDYTQRITVSGQDELSSLTKEFNELMARVQIKHEQFEDQVKGLKESEQTLEITNIKLTNEINERKHIEAKAATLHNKLILSARRAGMADIASGILHNVGNILNSVVTSLEVTKEKMTTVNAEKLTQMVELLKTHQADIAHFIATDPKGQRVTEYLSQLAKNWEDKDRFIMNEITNLDKNISYIKNAISMQQSLSSSAGMTEEVNLKELIEDAILLSKEGYERVGIVVHRDFAMNEKATIDRVKLLHILINLLKNSIDSLIESQVKPKEIRLSLHKKGSTEFMIEIRDNGMGIAVQNIKKIFAYGFSTKKTGHGFGLHTSAISAQEMGGTIAANSEGVGYGATFTLILPLFPQGKASVVQESSDVAE